MAKKESQGSEAHKASKAKKVSAALLEKRALKAHKANQELEGLKAQAAYRVFVAKLAHAEKEASAGLLVRLVLWVKRGLSRIISGKGRG